MKASIYSKIAEAVRDNKTILFPDKYLYRQLIDDIANILAADNPKFNKEKFLEDCTGGQTSTQRINEYNAMRSQNKLH